MKPFVKRFSLLLSILILPIVLSAATIHVPADQPTIQAGINAAADGDTVLLAPGTYTGDGNRDIAVHDKDLYIFAETITEPTIIDLQVGTGTGFSIYCDSIEIKDLTIKHAACGIQLNSATNSIFSNMVIESCLVGFYPYMAFRIDSSNFISNGTAIDLSAVYNPFSIVDCSFKNNNLGIYHADWGFQNPSQIIDSCFFDSNLTHVSSSFGGLTISNSIFYRGAIGLILGYPAFTYVNACTFSHIDSAVISSTRAGFQISDCNITDNFGNIAELYGPVSEFYGIWSYFDNCRFADNAGGIRCSCYCDNTLSLSNCLYINNGSPVKYLSPRGALRISGCTFVQNDSDAIESNTYNENIIIDSNIIGFNEGVGLNVSTTSNGVEVSCNNIFANANGNYSGADVTGLNGNISTDPRFCNMENDNFHLVANSPCAPENNACSTLIGALPVECDAIIRTWHIATFGNDTIGDGSLSNPFATIQRGIDVAVNGDTILVADGIYRGDGNRNISALGKAIVICSQNGSGFVTIDAQGAGDGFHLENYEEDTLTNIKGFTILDALNGLYMSHSAVKLLDLNISGSANYGIYGQSLSGLIIRNCKINDNANGIFIPPGCYFQTVVDSCELVGNSGKAISSENDGYGFVIKNCHFRNNGSCIESNYINDPSFCLIDSCVFDSNGTVAWGTFKLTNSNILSGVTGIGGSISSPFGGRDNIASNCIFENMTGTVITSANQTVISHCTIRDNFGVIVSGISKPEYYLNLTMLECHIINNAGGISLSGPESSYSMSGCEYADNGDQLSYSSSSSLGHCSISGCDFIFNSGNAISINKEGESASISNTIVARNGGYGLRKIGGIDMTISCCDVFDNMGGNYLEISDQTGINGNISLDPRFCYPSSADYHLAANSPCAPENNACSTLIGALPVACDAIIRTWYISTTGNDTTGDGSRNNPFATIQKGVNIAGDGDSVIILPGIYIGDGNFEVNLSGKSVSIIGEKGADSTYIDCDNLHGGFFDEWQDQSYSILISDLTINRAKTGIKLSYSCVAVVRSVVIMNCIYGAYTDPSEWTKSFINCEFRNNDTGLYSFPNWYGYTNVDSCLFDGNHLAMYATVNVNNSTITNSVTGIYGGAYADMNYTVRNSSFTGITDTVFVASTMTTIENCIIADNSGRVAYGFSVEDDNDINMTLSNCSIVNNTGGIYAWGDRPGIILSNCEYVGNDEGILVQGRYAGLSIFNSLYKGNGGPIQFVGSPGCGLTVRQSAFVDNPHDILLINWYDDGYGGPSANITIEHNTISFNSGIGITFNPGYGPSASITIKHNIISFNAGIGITFNYADPLYAIACNNIFENSDGNNYSGIPDQTGLNGNISLDPRFCNIENDSLYLYASSPCAPANNSCQALMGAFGVGCICGDADGSGSVNILDVAYIIKYLYKGGPAPAVKTAADADGNGAINILDVALLIKYLYKGGPAPNCP